MSTNPLAVGVPSLTPPAATQTMIAPDGSSGEVPVENVQAAVNAGGKVGMRMTAPDGSTGVVPVDRAHDAIAAGGKPSGITQGESPLYQQHPANVLYRDIRQRESPEKIAARQSTAKEASEDIEKTGQGLALTGGLLGAPVATIGAVVGSAVGGAGAKKSAEALGASPENAERAGDVGSLAGGLAGGVGGSALEEPVVAGLKSKLGSAVDTAKSWIKFDPTELHQGIQKIASDALGGAPVGAPRQAFQNAADTIYSQSKDLYAQIDEASGGKWSANESALKNVTQKLQDTTGTLSEDQEMDLLAKKTRFEWQQGQLLDEMASQGVPRPVIDAAKANYKQSMALYDLDAAVKSSTPIGKESVQGMKLSEEVNAKKLLPRITRLQDSGRLEQALPNGGAAEILGQAENADIQARIAARNANILKWGTRTVGAGAVGGEVIHALTK